MCNEYKWWQSKVEWNNNKILYHHCALKVETEATIVLCHTDNSSMSKMIMYYWWLSQQNYFQAALSAVLWLILPFVHLLDAGIAKFWHLFIVWKLMWGWQGGGW